MTVTSGISVACAVVIVLLVWMVVRLQRQIDQLGSLVSDLRVDVVRETASSTTDEVVLPSPPAPERGPDPDDGVELPTPIAEPAARAESSAEEPADQVSVITRMPETEDDLTTVRIASVTLGPPLIKVAAFSHGIRRALDEEQRMRISYAIRKELRRQRKMRRRRRSQHAPSEGWRP
jgi:hypothetical protein